MKPIAPIAFTSDVVDVATVGLVGTPQDHDWVSKGLGVTGVKA